MHVPGLHRTLASSFLGMFCDSLFCNWRGNQANSSSATSFEAWRSLAPSRLVSDRTAGQPDESMAVCQQGGAGAAADPDRVWSCCPKSRGPNSALVPLVPPDQDPHRRCRESCRALTRTPGGAGGWLRGRAYASAGMQDRRSCRAGPNSAPVTAVPATGADYLRCRCLADATNFRG